jgi:hypothetical protein
MTPKVTPRSCAWLLLTFGSEPTRSRPQSRCGKTDLADRHFGVILPEWGGIYNKKGRAISDYAFFYFQKITKRYSVD